MAIQRWQRPLFVAATSAVMVDVPDGDEAVKYSPPKKPRKWRLLSKLVPVRRTKITRTSSLKSIEAVPASMVPAKPSRSLSLGFAGGRARKSLTQQLASANTEIEELRAQLERLRTKEKLETELGKGGSSSAGVNGLVPAAGAPSTTGACGSRARSRARWTG